MAAVSAGPTITDTGLAAAHLGEAAKVLQGALSTANPVEALALIALIGETRRLEQVAKSLHGAMQQEAL